MTDGIANTKPVGASFTNSVKSRAPEAKPAATPAARHDALEVGSTDKLLEAESGFDAAKVASIKEAISNGSYPLDSKKMAASFAALERMVNSGRSQDSGAAD